MSDDPLRFAPDRSTIRVFTFAEGMLARLAHDLELVAEDGSGTLEEGQARVRFPIAKLRVVGIVKNGHTDPRALSAGDLGDMQGRMESAMRAKRDDAIEIDATWDAEHARATIEVTAPCGKTRAVTDAKVTEGEGEKTVSLRTEISLSALGMATIKGPMGAFRVSDRVKIQAEITFISRA